MSPLTTTVTKLHDVLAVVFVQLFTELTPEGNLVIVIYEGVVGQDAPANRDGHMRRDNRPDSAARKFFFPVDARLCPDAVVVIESAGDV